MEVFQQVRFSQSSVGSLSDDLSKSAPIQINNQPSNEATEQTSGLKRTTSGLFVSQNREFSPSERYRGKYNIVQVPSLDSSPVHSCHLGSFEDDEDYCYCDCHDEDEDIMFSPSSYADTQSYTSNTTTSTFSRYADISRKTSRSSLSSLASFSSFSPSSSPPRRVSFPIDIPSPRISPTSHEDSQPQMSYFETSPSYLGDEAEDVFSLEL